MFNRNEERQQFGGSASAPVVCKTERGWRSGTGADQERESATGSEAGHWIGAGAPAELLTPRILLIGRGEKERGTDTIDAAQGHRQCPLHQTIK